MQVSWVFFVCFGGGLVVFWSGVFFVCFVVCLGYSEKTLWLISQFQSGFEHRVAIRSGREHTQLKHGKAATVFQLQDFISVTARKSLRAKVSKGGQESVTQFVQTKDHSWPTLASLEAHVGWEAHSSHMLLVSLHTKDHNGFLFSFRYYCLAFFEKIVQSLHLRSSGIFC